MPPLLGPADSFNSSSATIRGGDDPHRRYAAPSGSSNTNINPFGADGGAQFGGLGPADSIGRELDAILGGRVGVLQSDAAVGDEGMLTRFLRDHSGTGAGTSSKLPLAREASEFNPLQFLNDATGGTFFSEVGMSSMSDLKAEPLSSPAGPPSGAHMTLNPAALTRAPRQQPDAEMPSPSPQQPYRPGSAMSHRSAHSLSSTDVDGDTEDSSFYTTDMDTEGEPELDPLDVSPPPIARLDLLNIGGRRLGPSGTALANTINPRAALASSAPRTSTRHMTGTAAADASFVPSSRALGKKRSVRGVTSHDEDEESRRAERLEHRRSINRKSAQKHRLRRKEELEDLSVAVRERDDKIRSLERDLAVANARISQMASILQGLMIKDAEGGR